MGKPICVNIPHSLGKAEAHRRVQQGFADIQKSIGLPGMLSTRQRWEEDRLHFEVAGLGQSLVGRLDVLADSVQIQIDLPDLLAALAESVSAKLRKRTQSLLE
jgi:hypothetical protein